MTEAIILAGGLGTRLRSVIHDIPKPMAEIQGKPFLSYLLDQLQFFGFKKVILSVGYKHQYIQQFYGNIYHGLEITYAIETAPLGTGGAIRNALLYTTKKDVLILNGDSIFLCDINELINFHYAQSATLTMALKKAQYFDRYGTVALNGMHRIIDFKEKQFVSEGIFNAGVYVMNKEVIEKLQLPQKFSFEKEILENQKNNLTFIGKVFDNYFVDIGIPDDYGKASRELLERTVIFKENFLKNVDNTWTLFLDRDGVINKQIIQGYVCNFEQFEFLPNVLEAIRMLSKIFSRIIVLTNQQCIGKSIVSLEAINDIHNKMLDAILQSGGRIDAVYYAPYLESENHIDRKPNVGMALRAKENFIDIDFAKTIMVGDSNVDMQFANNAGVKKIFLGNKEHNIPADIAFDDLYYFACFMYTMNKYL